jgi:ferric-dicitrate binding protein FerR (iron transport regulator)
MKDQRGGEIRALRHLIHEMSAEPEPELDWDRLESRLMEKVGEAPRPVARRGGWRWALAGAAAVLVAGGALVLRAPPEPANVSERPPAAERPALPASGPVDGAKLSVGAAVVSTQSAREVTHAGRARWTLEPASRAVLTESAERLGVRLEAGALLAEVVPGSAREAFAVEAGELRVAVHGTIFRVELGADRVLVGVREGVVSVAPRTPGTGQSWLLGAGDQGSFSLNGSVGTVQRATSETTAPAQPAPGRSARRRSAAGVPAEQAALPEAPAPAELERGLDDVAARTTRCFNEHTSRGEVRVVARTNIKLEVLADGSAGSLEFDPPLAPAVEKCIENAGAAARFPRSRSGATVERTILLGR